MERTNGKGKDFEPGLPMAALLVPAVCFGAGGILGWASVLFFAAEETRVSEKIRSNEKVTNSELRRTLAAYRDEVQPDQEG